MPRQGWKPLLLPWRRSWWSICESMSCSDGRAGPRGWLWYQPTNESPLMNRFWQIYTFTHIHTLVRRNSFLNSTREPGENQHGHRNSRQTNWTPRSSWGETAKLLCCLSKFFLFFLCINRVRYLQWPLPPQQVRRLCRPIACDTGTLAKPSALSWGNEKRVLLTALIKQMGHQFYMLQ